MTFSIYMACHNAENYIEKAIESVLNQTYTDLEVVIVDDGSTDKTSLILKELEIVVVAATYAGFPI